MQLKKMTPCKELAHIIQLKHHFIDHRGEQMSITLS